MTEDAANIEQAEVAEQPKPASVRNCPKCGVRKSIMAGKLVYPQSKDWWDRYCLICWPCNMVYRRGDGWLPIDLRRHRMEWKIEMQIQNLQSGEDRRAKR